MSLQHRLNWLLAAFVAFCLISTFGTVYAVHLHIGRGMADHKAAQAATTSLEQLRMAARERALALREVAAGLQPRTDFDDAALDDLFTQLQRVVRFAMGATSGTVANETLALGDAYRHAAEECLAAAAAGDTVHARTAAEQVSTEILPALERCLQQTRATQEDARAAAVDRVLLADNRLLIFTVILGAFGFAFVFGGAFLMHRWIIRPLRELEAATRAFGAGDLEHRVALTRGDELGQLGQALNEMAAGLTQAQSQLAASEAKYRTLFQNLRDTTLICDAQGRVIECQDGESSLLTRGGREFAGHTLDELWTIREGSTVDWPRIFGRALTRNEHVQVTDLRLPRLHDPTATAIVDVVAFPVQWADERFVALVLRDVTVQRSAEERLRRTEAMAATVTLARGVAHDFSGLLTTAIGSLSVLSAELDNGRPNEMARRALRACGQAVSLARTLMTFAGGEQGSPEPLPLRETVTLIVESLHEEQWPDIRLTLELDDVTAFVDRDQFTEIVLNLVRNACEAMAAGGDLTIRLEASKLPGTLPAEGPPTHALLTVIDTGVGIPPGVRDRLFEPFFSTKAAPGARRTRGLGLSVVYAAVKNAGGLIEVQSALGQGTTMRVWLPFPAQTVGERTLVDDAAVRLGHGTSLG